MEAATLTRQQEDMTSRPAESKTSGYLKVLCCSLARPNPAEACLSEWIRPASDYVRLARPRKCDSGLIWSEIGSREDKKKGKGKIRGNANRRKYQERKLVTRLGALMFEIFIFSVLVSYVLAFFCGSDLAGNDRWTCVMTIRWLFHIWYQLQDQSGDVSLIWLFSTTHLLIVSFLNISILECAWIKNNFLNICWFFVVFSSWHGIQKTSKVTRNLMNICWTPHRKTLDNICWKPDRKYLLKTC